MKILQVITNLLSGGAETLVVNLVPRLRALGNEVDVCVFDGRETPLMQRLRVENPGIKIWKLGHGVYNPLFILKLIPIMQRYDIVHTHNSSPQLFVALASLCCHCRIFTTEHTTSNRKRQWKWYAPIESWMYGRYEHVICISEIAEEKLREYMGGDWLNSGSVRYDHISTVNNGVDVEAFHEAEPLPDVRRDGTFVTTMVARFRAAKDQDTLVKTLALLPKNYVAWLVGDGERMEEVKALAEQQGVGDRVTFWGARNDVPRILKSSDVVCMSSHWEGLSLSNIEGMSVGKPFIASDVNGLREVTKDYGLLFPEGDAETLADLLRKLHDDAGFYTDVANRCYVRAQQFDIKATAEKYNDAYHQLPKEWRDNSWPKIKLSPSREVRKGSAKNMRV